MATEVGDTPLRVLPYDVAITPRAGIGNVLKRRQELSPPSVEALRAEGLVADEHDPDRWFSADERLTVAWLRGRGVDVVSVQRREGRHLKTPDAVAPSAGVTLEIKHPVATSNAIVQRVRVGRKQSRRIVIDLRGSGADRDLAEIALGSAIRMYGDHLDEVVLIVNDDLALGWTHG
jgi:hypothetical protein